MQSTTMLRRVLQLPPALRRQFWSSAKSEPEPPIETGPELFDVVCVGGGPAGLSLVSALRAHPSSKDLKIALIDSQALSKPTSTPSPDLYSNRCSSLTPSSLRFLNQIGAWDHADQSRTQHYHAMNVWDGVSGSKVHFDPLDKSPTIMDMIPGSRWQASRKAYESPDSGAIATMCENSNLTAALLTNLSSQPPVTLLDIQKVSSITLGPEPTPGDETSLDLSQWPLLTLPSSPRPLAARLLIGADGANSPVRAFADIPSKGWDYERHGLVATLDLSHALPISPETPRTAYQRFLPTGPIALLPLPGNKASLVWSTTPAHAAHLKTLSSEDFVSMVNAAFRLLPVDLEYMHTLPSGQQDELQWREPATSAAQTGLPASFPRVVGVQEATRASFPLRMRHADTYTGHRVALLGDAAHTIHPLAGQGLNLGLADAEALAAGIVRGLECGMDIGTNWCLDGYQEERWGRNNAMLGTVDKLHKLYSAGSGPVVWGRSLGLDLVDRLGPVKGFLMGAAAGR